LDLAKASANARRMKTINTNNHHPGRLKPHSSALAINYSGLALSAGVTSLNAARVAPEKTQAALLLLPHLFFLRRTNEG